MELKIKIVKKNYFCVQKIHGYQNFTGKLKKLLMIQLNEIQNSIKREDTLRFIDIGTYPWHIPRETLSA